MLGRHLSQTIGILSPDPLLRSRGLSKLASTLVAPTTTVLNPRKGIVVVKKALSDEEQLKLAQCATEIGLSPAPGGFFDENGKPNSRTYRGRVFSSIDRWPHFASEWCSRALSTSMGIDKSLPAMNATHVLLLAYMSNEGVGWHRDIYENDGRADRPIVTVNLGNACEFMFKDDHSSPKTYVGLESGDVLIFGGSARYAMHKVSRVVQGSCPKILESTLSKIIEKRDQIGSDVHKTFTPNGNSVRLSLTFRDAPSVIGREHEFATFKVDKHFDKDANFSWTQDQQQVPAQPGQEK